MAFMCDTRNSFGSLVGIVIDVDAFSRKKKHLQLDRAVRTSYNMKSNRRGWLYCEHRDYVIRLIEPCYV